MLGQSSLHFVVNPKYEKHFDKLLGLISEDGARVAIFNAPLFSAALEKAPNMVEMNAYYDSLSKARGIPYYDFSSIPMSKDTTFFYDAIHLNLRGAEAFTDTLARSIAEGG